MIDTLCHSLLFRCLCVSPQSYQARRQWYHTSRCAPSAREGGSLTQCAVCALSTSHGAMLVPCTHTCNTRTHNTAHAQHAPNPPMTYTLCDCHSNVTFVTITPHAERLETPGSEPDFMLDNFEARHYPLRPILATRSSMLATLVHACYAFVRATPPRPRSHPRSQAPSRPAAPSPQLPAPPPTG